MNTKQFPSVQEIKTVELTKGQLFWHYSILVFFLIVPCITTVDAFRFYIFQTYDGVRPLKDVLLLGYLPIVPAIFWYFFQKRKLRFKSIYIQLDGSSFKKAAEQTAKELEWEFIKKTSNIIIAKSGFTWRSWGELITIIREKDKILINSICDPDNRPSVASWGMNKFNKRIFEQYARKVSA